MAGKAPFHYIDEFIFKQVEELRSQEPFSSLKNSLSVLPDSQRKIANYLMTIGFLSIPIVATLIYGFVVFSSQSELETRKEILQKQKSLQSKQVLFENLSRSLLSRTPIASKPDLEKLIGTAVANTKAPARSAKVNEFDQKDDSGLTITTANVTFSRLTTTQFAGTVGALINANNIFVEEVIIQKDKKSNKIDVELRIKHYGKSST